MNAKLVHIAVRSAEPRTLADFYKRAFGLREVLSNRKAVDLWDGYLFLAINPPTANGRMGLNHFGFLVENVDALRPVLERAGASRVDARPAGRSFTDWRVHDPEGNPIDLSSRGYDTIPAERLEKASGDGAMNELRRLVVLTENPERLAEFYKEVFGLAAKNFTGGVVLTDGVMRLVLLKRSGASGLYAYGLAAHGDETLRRLKDLDMPITSEPDWIDTSKRQLMLRDPEGNLAAIFGAS
jgi:catechol 2,3-dioxygenase-like lactoylglutathione lyase family enzyme/predicted enzyme related to lactoylglutathione lyase